MPLTQLNRPTLAMAYQGVNSLEPGSTQTRSKTQIGQIASAIRRLALPTPYWSTLTGSSPGTAGSKLRKLFASTVRPCVCRR